MSPVQIVIEAAAKQALKLFKGTTITPQKIAKAADAVMAAAKKAVKVRP